MADSPVAPSASVTRSLARFLGLRRNTVLLLAALLVAGTGERLWLGFAPKYLETLGATAGIIGLVDGLQTLIGTLYAYPGGWLTDHWGQRRSLMAFSLCSLFGYGLVLVWQHWLAVALGAFLFLAWSAFSLPATFSIVADTLRAQQHTMGIGMQSLVRRVPMMLGPLLGAVLITRFDWRSGVRYALLICVGFTILTMAFQWFMVDADKDGVARRPITTSLGLLDILRRFSPALRELLLSDILIRFCERIPYAFVILWAMDYCGITVQQYSLLVACEMIVAMVCYIPVSHMADRFGRRPFVFATFVFFTLFPLSLLFARNFHWLILAFGIRGLKEFGEPARKALIISEAPAELKSRAYGAYYLVRDCVVSVGSLLGAALWWCSPRANFAGAAVFGILGTTWFAWFLGREPRPEKS